MLFEGRMITIGDTGLITLQGTKIPQAKKKKKIPHAMQQISPWLQSLSRSPITKTWHNQINKYFKKFNYVWEHTASYLTYGKHTYPTFVITLFSTWFFKMGVLLFVKWEVLCLKGCVSYFCFHIPSPCEHLPVMCAAFPFTHCIL